jgi:hypothetical protein
MSSPYAGVYKTDGSNMLLTANRQVHRPQSTATTPAEGEKGHALSFLRPLPYLENTPK